MEVEEEKEKKEEKEDSNSCIHFYLQGKDNNMHEKLCFQLIESVFDEEMYDQLRNKEQLGYMVAAVRRQTNGVPGLSLYIRSAEHNPCYLEERINAFLKQIEQRFKDETSLF